MKNDVLDDIFGYHSNCKREHWLQKVSTTHSWMLDAEEIRHKVKVYLGKQAYARGATKLLSKYSTVEITPQKKKRQPRIGTSPASSIDMQHFQKSHRGSASSSKHSQHLS